ncbi:hypothetical protein MNV49_000945 [Pseudohyphozyma bogoriensis]|nr:hypothetical protein MNV49_000945 [Pseudohyphozyma bogoriensis]
MLIVTYFCLWGSPGTTPDGVIGNVEAAVVAYCSRSGHGSRIFPPGTITGIQFMRTSQYIQITGVLNQTGLNLDPSDSGVDVPHRHQYSSGLNATDNSTLEQVVSWNNFIGSGVFCFKLCGPLTYPNYCENRYDLIGCNYNAPAAYEAGVFESCDGELQDVVGTYTDSFGTTQTWSQPTSFANDATLPWTPRIPRSSNCVRYKSTDLFPDSLLGYQCTFFYSYGGFCWINEP